MNYLFTAIGRRFSRWHLGGLLVLWLLVSGAGTARATAGPNPDPDINTVKVSLSLTKTTRLAALQHLEQRTSFRFVYRPSQFKTAGTFDLVVDQKTVAEVLRLIFREHAVELKQVGKQVFITRGTVPQPTAAPTTAPPVPAFGAVVGRVTDVSGEPLPGATVVLLKSLLGEGTNTEGRFLMQRVPAGTVRFVVSYLGFETVEREVLVEGGKTTTLTIRLEPTTVRVAEVVVKGAALEGQERALNQQRSADNIKNLVSADLINRFPDLNVAEALQRVPGINIQRNRGEGGTVTMRGTPPNFSTININGEQIPSTERDDGGTTIRSESLDLIPVDQLAGLEITKSLTPDQDGDAIGGSINLRTPVAKALKQRGKAEIGGGYNNLSGGLNGIGSLSLDQRFLATSNEPDGRLGVIVGGSYFGTDNGEDRIEATWKERDFARNPAVARRFGRDNLYVLNDYRYRDLQNRRTRIGASTTLDYKLSATSSVFLNVLYSRLEDRDVRRRVRFDLDRVPITQYISPDTILGVRIRRDVREANPVKTNLTFTLGGEQRLRDVLVDWNAFYTRSTRDAVFYRSEVQASSLSLRAEDLNSPQTEFIGLNQSIHDPFAYTVPEDYIPDGDQELNRGSNLALRLNARLPFTYRGEVGSFQFGGKYRRFDNDQVRNNTQLDYRGADADDYLVRHLSNFESTNFMNGAVRFGPGLDPAKVRAFYEANKDQYAPNISNAFLNLNETFYAREGVLAGYALARVPMEKLLVLGGLRYERTMVDYRANRVSRSPGDNALLAAQPVTGDRAYHFLLPNVQLRYALTALTNLRLAATYSYGRPNFSDLVPRESYSPVDATIQRGNENLRPAKSLNLDLLAERYLNNVGILSAGLFFKNINAFQFESQLLVPKAEYPSVFPDTINTAYRVTQTLNGDVARVYGAEVNIQAPLRFLPGLLGGFTVYANYTFTHSSAFTATRRGIRLPGQTPHTANGSLSYDYKGLTLRASLNYNGAFIRQLGDRDATDFFRAARAQLDLSTQYKVGKSLSFYGEWINVTSAKQLEYFGVEDRPTQVNYFSHWTRFGMAYTF